MRSEQSSHRRRGSIVKGWNPRPYPDLAEVSSRVLEVAYRSDAWQTLFAAVASASAALTGLLFVGLSLNLRKVIGTP